MSTLSFADEMAQLQRALAQCHDMVVRRCTVLEALRLRPGERVLEVGCGGGFYAYEAARCVGPTGRVCAVDVSADQIAAARSRCSELVWVDCRRADAVELPYGNEEFDAVYGVQVFEYVPKLDDALREAHRVLRRGGQLAIFATNWSSMVWHSANRERMRRILAAWELHALYPDLPALLPGLLRRAELQPVRQTPVPVLNTSFHTNSFSFWLARMIHAFLLGRRTPEADEAEVWLQELDELERQGTYFFCSTPILTEAIRVG